MFALLSSDESKRRASARLLASNEDVASGSVRSRGTGDEEIKKRCHPSARGETKCLATISECLL